MWEATIWAVAALIALLLLAVKKDTTIEDDGETEERLPIWEQITLSGARAVTYATEGMTFQPLKLIFGAGGILEQQGWNVPPFALTGKGVPPGGKLCAIIIEVGQGNAILTHGSLVSSLAELATSWAKDFEPVMQGPVNGCEVIEILEENAQAIYDVKKGDGQFATLWIERVS
jgi:hypothetical protein